MAVIKVRSLVPYCPLLREKCLGEKCAWHIGKGCSVVRIAKSVGGGKPS